jgi:thiol-disulfide isomerase/thioredoxin
MFAPFKVLLPAVAAACLAAPAFADGPMWFADFDAAQAEAQKTGKDMLVDFTGSDWCGWCKKLHAEVFDIEAFQKGVESDFVLVALDFPRDEAVKAKVPNPARNDELLKQHAVNGFPTILLMTPAGEVYGRTGYRPDGAEPYVAHLGELRTSGKRALEQLGELEDAYATAEGEAKLQAWDRLADLAVTLDSDSPFGARLAEPLKGGIAMDPKNEQGRKLRAVEALIKLGQADEAVYAAVPELDPTNEHGLGEQALEARFAGVNSDTTARLALASLIAFDSTSKFKDTERATRMYANVAMWLAGPLADPEAAKPWARKALDLKPADAGMVSALEQIVAGS